jgi:hypothetical protein
MGEDVERDERRVVLVAERDVLARLLLGVEADEHDKILRARTPPRAGIRSGRNTAEHKKHLRLGRVANPVLRARLVLAPESPSTS